jgi:hypothetical protein
LSWENGGSENNRNLSHKIARGKIDYVQLCEM